MVTRLDRRRFAPSICVLRRGGRRETEVEALGIPLLEAPFTVAPRPLATLGLRVRRAAEGFRDRFALWHSYHYLDDYTEPLIARAARARAWIYTKKNMSWNQRSWWVRTFLASRVAALNRDMLRDYFASPLFRGKTRLVPCGVDTERFRPETEKRLELRRRLGIPENVVVLGCVAQIVPIKGHPILLDAVARVPELHLWLAGRELDARYASELRRQAKELGIEDRVSFLGEIQDVPALLAELDLFVLPTPSGEGLGVALLEAMACGLPCLAADVPGLRDLIEHGRSGLLVKPNDASALADAIGRLSTDGGLRRELGRAARDRAVRSFSIEAEVRAYEDLYAEALGIREAVAV